MNTQDNLLKDEADMCSFCEDDMENMCSNKEYDTCGDGSIAITKVKVNRQKSLEIRGLQTNGHVWIRGCWSIFMLWWETYRLMGISESGIGLWLRNGYMVG